MTKRVQPEALIKMTPDDDAEHANDNARDQINFASMEGFTLKLTKRIKQLNHVVWNRYGQLMKNGKPVDRVKDRVYCITCFEKSTFKR